MWDFTVNVFRWQKPGRRRRPAFGMHKQSKTLANLPRWSVHKVSLICIRSIHYSNNCDLLRKYCCGHWTVWAREPERVTRGEQLESLGTSRWGWGAWRMTRPTGSMNANVQPGDRGRGPSVGLHGKEVMFNLHGTWIHKHTQELTWSHAWNASIIASFWTCQIFDRWHSRCCVPQVAVGSEWGQDAEGDWGCEDTSLVAWRTMSCSPHLFLLRSFSLLFSVALPVSFLQLCIQGWQCRALWWNKNAWIIW